MSIPVTWAPRPTSLRGSQVTQAAQSSLTHWPGSCISECSAASHHPAHPTLTPAARARTQHRPETIAPRGPRDRRRRRCDPAGPRVADPHRRRGGAGPARLYRDRPVHRMVGQALPPRSGAAVLGQILNACTGGEHRRMPTQAPARRIRGQTTHAKPGSQSLLLVRTQRLAVDNRTHNLPIKAKRRNR